MRDILDLDTFPLDRARSRAWCALVDRCRGDLAADGMFNLQGFMQPRVAERVVAEMTPRFETASFLHERHHDIYFSERAGQPGDHPALQRFRTSNRTLCADQIEGSALLRLYGWPEFATFLAATMDKPALHVMEDPLARVNVMSYGEGQQLNWHFDRSEFTTTLLLQAPETGGEFEYRTGLRSDDDPNHEGVARLLRGNDPETRTVALSPGTLNVFRGRNTAHRVTPVSGSKERVVAVFSYFERSGVVFSTDERVGFYGRAQ